MSGRAKAGKIVERQREPAEANRKAERESAMQTVPAWQRDIVGHVRISLPAPGSVFACSLPQHVAVRSSTFGNDTKAPSIPKQSKAIRGLAFDNAELNRKPRLQKP